MSQTKKNPEAVGAADPGANKIRPVCNAQFTTADALAQQASRNAQRARLLHHLRTVKGGLTTIEARERLNILHPAGRVLELRERGHSIITVWQWQSDAFGRRHRVGTYYLVPEGKGGAE